MVSMRLFAYLLIFFMLQVHAKVSNAKFINSQAPQAAIRGVSVASTITHTAKKVDVIGNRKVLKHVNGNEKNGLEIESKEMVRKRRNKKKVTKTVSLTADYRDPGHHPPRHN